MAGKLVSTCRDQCAVLKRQVPIAQWHGALLEGCRFWPHLCESQSNRNHLNFDHTSMKTREITITQILTTPMWKQRNHNHLNFDHTSVKARENTITQILTTRLWKPEKSQSPKFWPHLWKPEESQSPKFWPHLCESQRNHIYPSFDHTSVKAREITVAQILTTPLWKPEKSHLPKFWPHLCESQRNHNYLNQNARCLSWDWKWPPPKYNAKAL